MAHVEAQIKMEGMQRKKKRVGMVTSESEGKEERVYQEQSYLAGYGHKNK